MSEPYPGQLSLGSEYISTDGHSVQDQVPNPSVIRFAEGNVINATNTQLWSQALVGVIMQSYRMTFPDL